MSDFMETPNLDDIIPPGTTWGQLVLGLKLLENKASSDLSWQREQPHVRDQPEQYD